MAYFNFFPKVAYSFGDGEIAGMQNISVYAEVLDDIKNNGSFYQSYYVKTGERPDQVAYNLYGNPDLHWTFYLMNDHIRNIGWPISQPEVLEKVMTDYSGTVLRTHDELFTLFKVGQTVRGNISGAEGTIVFRDLSLGHVVLENVTGTFQADELVSDVATAESITILSSTPEHLAPRYYVDGDGERVDFCPFTGPGELNNTITQLDYYTAKNDEQRLIQVLRPNVINKVVSAFRDAVRS